MLALRRARRGPAPYPARSMALRSLRLDWLAGPSIGERRQHRHSGDVGEPTAASSIRPTRRLATRAAWTIRRLRQLAQARRHPFPCWVHRRGALGRAVGSTTMICGYRWLQPTLAAPPEPNVVLQERKNQRNQPRGDQAMTHLDHPRSGTGKGEELAHTALTASTSRPPRAAISRPGCSANVEFVKVAPGLNRGHMGLREDRRTRRVFHLVAVAAWGRRRNDIRSVRPRA
jgi:hypothetical protein